MDGLDRRQGPIYTHKPPTTATAGDEITTAPTSSPAAEASVISFDPNFKEISSPQDLTLSWTGFNTSIAIEKVAWIVLDSSKDQNVTLTEGSPIDKNSTYFSYIGNSSVTFDVDALYKNRTDSALLNDLMVVQVNWKTKYATGNSTTHYLYLQGHAEALGQGSSSNDHEYESIVWANGDTNSNSASASPGGVEPGGGDVDAGSHNGGGGGGGLSTGAIVGIAVGGGVAVILIAGLLLWFLRRRRRQTNAAETSFRKQSDPAAFFEDKNARLHVAEDSVAHLPYTDRSAAGAAANNTHGLGEPDNQNGSNEALPRSVAHLVEDGMNDDDIRRLEAEERMLDDEIERAGRQR